MRERKLKVRLEGTESKIGQNGNTVIKIGETCNTESKIEDI